MSPSVSVAAAELKLEAYVRARRILGFVRLLREVDPNKCKNALEILQLVAGSITVVFFKIINKT